MSPAYTCFIFHATLLTKELEPFLQDKSIREELYGQVSNTAKDPKYPIFTVCGTADHLHILFQVDPDLSIDYYINQFKQTTKTWLISKGISNFAWEEEYGGQSISRSELEAAQRYIIALCSENRTIFFQDFLDKNSTEDNADGIPF